MSMILIERNSLLEYAPESSLKLDGNMVFWLEDAVAVPLRQWPQWRDKEINTIFDQEGFWQDPMKFTENEPIPVVKGMGTTYAVRRGRIVKFYRQSAKGNKYPLSPSWEIGTPLPAELGYNPATLATRWDEIAQWARSEFIRGECLGGWYGARWEPLSPEEETVYEKIVEAVRQYNWELALAVIPPEDNANRLHDKFLKARRYLRWLVHEERDSCLYFSLPRWMR